jgi:DNA-directed RNA polymerase subunit RPC12/RpoP
MKKLVKCPVCGNDIVTLSEYKKFKCPKCNTRLDADIVKEISKPEEKELKKPVKKFSLEILKPNEMKIFIFLIFGAYSLVLLAVAKYKIIFSLTFFPVLYWFSCKWESEANERNLELKDYLKDVVKEFVLLVLVYFIIFFIIPAFAGRI